MIAAEWLVAVGRMIDVYRRGHGATTDSKSSGWPWRCGIWGSGTMPGPG